MRRLLCAVGGAAAVAGCLAGLLSLGPADDSHPTAAAPQAGAVAGAANLAVTTARKRTERYPDDPAVWSGLARAEVEQARITLDAGRLDAADRALRRSLSLRREDNYAAVTGQGLVANARHEFADGRDFGLRATRMAPDRADGYAVLADAQIQLGDYPAARSAVQRLLDIAPAGAAYSRAAYDLETNGRPEDAAIALQRAVDSASTPDERAFAEARLGELAWSQGAVDRAERHFRLALDAVPGHPYGESGLARVYAVRGDTAKALGMYRELTGRAPLPQFLAEAVELGGEDGSRVRTERAALDAQVRLLRVSGGPVDPHLALYVADHGDPDVAVGLMRGEWKRARSVIVADALGWALHRAGHDSEALGYARKAAGTGWGNALFRYHRGVIEHAVGLPDGSCHLREALALNPHFSPYHVPLARRLLKTP
ncbi:tetratricopeptide repeat protein [Streptomyces sp. BE230]|uniref:tetratricopeptide repeat protein n=1 Tax=Streptomyces sp. BE230 TaxID=3002526 RepID=UPI002ED204E6|nr:tetratricopeptide repeat protein [Streptomyces sp. BE230]